MRLALTDLSPHFLKRLSPVDFEHTDSIHEADGLQLQCPACKGNGRYAAHTVILWEDPEHWSFEGSDYRDLSLMAGWIMVNLTAGRCRTRFYIKNGKVDFF